MTLLVHKIYTMRTCKPEILLRQHINNIERLYENNIIQQHYNDIETIVFGNVAIWWQCFDNIQCYVGIYSVPVHKIDFRKDCIYYK